MTIQPLEVSVDVPLAAAEAYDVFTSRFGEWWPLHKFSVDSKNAKTAVFGESEIYEVLNDGTRAVWGEVTSADPGRAVAFVWHPARDASTGQRIDVSFFPNRVVLVHREWEGVDDEQRTSYEKGWPFVLGEYARFCGM